MSYKASTPFKIVSLFLTRSIPQFFILARPMINCTFFSNSVNSHCPITLQENEAEDPLNTSIVTFQLYRPWQTRTHCCRHKCFPVCPRAQHLLRTQILCPGHKKCFPVCAAQETSWATMCPQQCVLVYQGLMLRCVVPCCVMLYYVPL